MPSVALLSSLILEKYFLVCQRKCGQRGEEWVWAARGCLAILVSITRDPSTHALRILSIWGGASWVMESKALLLWGHRTFLRWPFLTWLRREIIVDRKTDLCQATLKIETVVFNFHGACFRCGETLSDEKTYHLLGTSCPLHTLVHHSSLITII